MVTIWPSFISTLMTSDAFTDILWARSATVMVSGTDTSRTTGSDGIDAPAPLPSSCRSCLRCPFGPRQPPAPPEASPRVFSARFFCCSSDQLDASLPDLTSLTPGFFSSFLSLLSVFAAGLCSVPAGATGATGWGACSTFFGAAIMVLIAATSSSTALRARSCASCACRAASSASFCARSAFCSSSAAAASRAFASVRSSSSFCCASATSRCARSAFSRAAAVWRATSSAWRRASSSRLASSASSITGAAGTGAAASWGCSGAPSSRLTNTRFLRTSTWIVRALPDASACLISVVCLRVSVIFFFSGAPSPAPCALRSDSSKRDLSSSVSESDSAILTTPAAFNCSSSNCGGSLSSVANWATVVLAIGFLVSCCSMAPSRRRFNVSLHCAFTAPIPRTSARGRP